MDHIAAGGGHLVLWVDRFEILPKQGAARKDAGARMAGAGGCLQTLRRHHRRDHLCLQRAGGKGQCTRLPG